eukprot:TRINITY_DN5637_c0_g1_i1.p1 TRINITY_DN5637_c0_g1~~TRINITY_DN5637_c0_g1_i1.p1  ORF type:complete len:289 (+),score=44.15 TRINITY_DN5637_c0_g1_i1:606-1472(+)
MLTHPRGRTILRLNNDSCQLTFIETYPELVPQYGRMTDGYWRNRIAADRFVIHHLNFVERTQDLEELSTNFIVKCPGGSTMLNSCNGSLQMYINQMYPEILGRYGRKANRNFWNNPKQNQAELFYMMRRFDVKQKEDWYRVSSGQLSMAYGRSLRKGQIVKLLVYWYPEEAWDYIRFSEKINKRSAQRYLGLSLLKLYKDEVIFEDYVFRHGERVYVFDFYIPGMKVVIEYQGEQHYFNVSSWGSLEYQQQRDKEKKHICQLHQLRIVEIPFWWDYSEHSLKQIIQDS